MSNLASPANARPWYMMNYPRSGRNPFQSIGMDYCIFCKQEVDTDTEAYQRQTTYVYRRRCLRCGRVVNWGVFDNCALISSTPVLEQARNWVNEQGEDHS